MAISSINSGSAASYGISLTKPNETSATSTQAALPRVAAAAPVSSATTSDSSNVTAPASTRPAGGVPLASTSNEDALEASITAALARAQALVGASEAENVVNEDGSIDYAALSKIVAEQQAKLQTENVISTRSTQPVNVVDILA